jgi:hypothetical protein
VISHAVGAARAAAHPSDADWVADWAGTTPASSAQRARTGSRKRKHASSGSDETDVESPAPAPAKRPTVQTEADDEKQLREWVEAAQVGERREFVVETARRAHLHNVCRALQDEQGYRLTHTSSDVDENARKLTVVLQGGRGAAASAAAADTGAQAVGGDGMAAQQKLERLRNTFGTRQVTRVAELGQELEEWLKIAAPGSQKRFDVSAAKREYLHAYVESLRERFGHVLAHDSEGEGRDRTLVVELKRRGTAADAKAGAEKQAADATAKTERAEAKIRDAATHAAAVAAALSEGAHLVSVMTWNCCHLVPNTKQAAKLQETLDRLPPAFRPDLIGLQEVKISSQSEIEATVARRAHHRLQRRRPHTAHSGASSADVESEGEPDDDVDPDFNEQIGEWKKSSATKEKKAAELLTGYTFYHAGFHCGMYVRDDSPLAAGGRTLDAKEWCETSTGFARPFSF